ncbi:MAG: S24 family peptidase, partial [Alphaproteobacteria bacterium]|nr:S24 family peptidase [Alphaproteobacteria bacterium]
YLMPRPAASFLLWASGDSMVEAGILDGDLLVVDRSITPTSGQIVVAVLDGGLVLKRLVRRGAVWWLAAANRNYPDLRIGEFSETVIWGVAVYAIHRLNGQDAQGAARRTGEPNQRGRLL